MPKLSRTPSYRLHKATGQACVTLNGKTHYLGKHGSIVSLQRYDALIAEWLEGGRQLPNAGPAFTVAELIVAYLTHARGYYTAAEAEKIAVASRPLRRLYGRSPAGEFGPRRLKAVRQVFVGAGNCRSFINQQIGRIKRVFKWGVEAELVPASVWHGLQAVAGLRRGRSGVPERTEVQPVPDEHVEAIRAHVPRQVWAMIELQRLTGMRPGEIVIMRGCDVDTDRKIWLYRPHTHKNTYRGHERCIDLGPKASEIVRGFLKADLSAYLFDPRDSIRERAQRCTTHRRANQQTTRRNTGRSVRDHYDVASYRRCIQRACRALSIPSWHPHQLRHTFGTGMRKQFGLEISRCLLGHRSIAAAEIYSEVDRATARKVLASCG